MTTSRPGPEVWFLTGSQGLYGPETLEQVAAQSQGIVARLAESPELPVRVVWKPVLLDSASIHRRDPRGEQRRRLRRRHRLDAHLLAGEDVDQRPGRAAEAAAAPAHAGGHGPAVVDHRHGLHEPQPGRARRPRVRLHPVPPGRRAQDRRRPRGLAGRGLADRGLGAGGGRARTTCATCGWPGSATTCATSRSPRATRSRPSCGSASRSTPTASTTSSPSWTRSTTPTSTRW